MTFNSPSLKTLLKTFLETFLKALLLHFIHLSLLTLPQLKQWDS